MAYAYVFLLPQLGELGDDFEGCDRVDLRAFNQTLERIGYLLALLERLIKRPILRLLLVARSSEPLPPQDVVEVSSIRRPDNADAPAFAF